MGMIIQVSATLIRAARSRPTRSRISDAKVKIALELNGDAVEVVEVSNQSTGFRPEPGSWPAVAAALDRIGVGHLGRYTIEVEHSTWRLRELKCNPLSSGVGSAP